MSPLFGQHLGARQNTFSPIIDDIGVNTSGIDLRGISSLEVGMSDERRYPILQGTLPTRGNMRRGGKTKSHQKRNYLVLAKGTCERAHAQDAGSKCSCQCATDLVGSVVPRIQE